jgi:hypothetical protein
VHPVPNWIDASAKTLPLPRMPKLIAACEFNYLETYRAMFGKCFARFVAADETFELIRVKGCSCFYGLLMTVLVHFSLLCLLSQSLDYLVLSLGLSLSLVCTFWFPLE